jgi:hypothetical protein
MSHEIIRHLKELKLHGMAQSWPEMVGQTRLAEFDPVSFMTQLLRSESAEREVRSIAYQMTAAASRPTAICRASTLANRRSLRA